VRFLSMSPAHVTRELDLSVFRFLGKTQSN
jgi:hypothetical protein